MSAKEFICRLSLGAEAEDQDGGIFEICEFHKSTAILLDLLCPVLRDTWGMREVIQDASPSLFDAPPPESYVQAREFVRWCCGFGTEFRNSPDVSNLRFWAQKNKIKLKPHDEAEILDTARPLFSRRIEQAVRKFERTETHQTAN